MPHRADTPSHEPSRFRVRLERITLAGLAGSAVVHLLIVLVAALVTVRYSLGDVGGSGGQGVEFAVLDESALAEDTGLALAPERAAVETSVADSPVPLDLLAATSGQQRSIDDLSESIAPALDPGGGGLAALDAQTGSAGAGSGQGGSFFGLEAKGRRFAYIVDVSGSMNQRVTQSRTRWDQTRAELTRSIRALEPDAEFHVQLFSSDSASLFGVRVWSRANAVNKRLAADGLLTVDPDGGTEPLGGFETVFALDPRPDAIYFMSDGEVRDAEAFAAAVGRMNGRDRVTIHCVLVGDAGGGDALRRVEQMMQAIARRSGGRYVRIREGAP